MNNVLILHEGKIGYMCMGGMIICVLEGIYTSTIPGSATCPSQKHMAYYYQRSLQFCFIKYVFYVFSVYLLGVL